MKIALSLCLLYAALQLKTAESSQDLMKDLVVGFTKTLNECIDEMKYPDSVKQDFYNFWKPDHVVTDTKFGCTVICIAVKLDLLHPNGNIHHGNVHEFVTKHGANDQQAQQLVDLVHTCDKEVTEDLGECARTLAVSNCFKKKIHDLDWAPSVEVILAEILTDGEA